MGKEPHVRDMTEIGAIIHQLHLTHYQTTNFRLFRTEKILQTTILDLTKMTESYSNG